MPLFRLFGKFANCRVEGRGGISLLILGLRRRCGRKRRLEESEITKVDTAVLVEVDRQAAARLPKCGLERAEVVEIDPPVEIGVAGRRAELRSRSRRALAQKCRASSL